jgi:hypothetical protein
LIDVWVDSWRFHEQSVRCYPLCFKGSPRILALSLGTPSAPPSRLVERTGPSAAMGELETIT